MSTHCRYIGIAIYPVLYSAMKIGVSSPFEQALPWQPVNTALISHRAIKEPTKGVGHMAHELYSTYDRADVLP